jgi:hypothetical protein
MSHSMTDPAGETCEHGVRWAFDCAQCGEFGETLQFCSFPKLSTNSAWELVPVEPTDAMLEAMQAAGLAAFDADVAASLGDTPLDPTHARRAVWQAALDAAPDIENDANAGGGAGSVRRLIGITQGAVDHRAVMRQAIEALRDAHAYSVMHEEFRDGVLDVIDALRKALASDALDRLAQADRELGLGERA